MTSLAPMPPSLGTAWPEPVWLDNDTRLPTEQLAGLVAQALRREGDACAIVALGAGEAAPGHDGVRGARGPAQRETIAAMRRERPETRLLCFAGRADPHDARAVGAATVLRFTEPAPHRVAWQLERDGRVVGAQRLPAGVRIEAELAHTVAPLVHAFGRLARTIARRRVGVALSGGGAWGFAHCALLHGLAARGIPVDVIAGTSFGSMVGAFHAAGALAALIEQAPHMPRMARWCSLSTAPIERFIEHQLGDRSVEDLEITFLPVAVDLVAAREIVITSGSVAAGVRASCAFPGLWGPMVVGGARYVDGCITSNVPVAAVADAGADLVIASCVMRPPSPRPPAPPGSRLARWWAPLSPRRRAHDLRRAIRLWAYTASCRQVADAHLAFVPDLAPFRITEFAAAPHIIARAAAQLGPLLDAASARYAALGAARGSMVPHAGSRRGWDEPDRVR